jgi:hypothetical protein
MSGGSLRVPRVFDLAVGQKVTTLLKASAVALHANALED